MARRTGEKIILLADILWGLCILTIGLGITALVLLILVSLFSSKTSGYPDFMIPFIIIALSCYISQLILRGYGELIDNTQKISDNLDAIIVQSSNSATITTNTKICSICGFEQPAKNNFCKNCGVPLRKKASAHHNSHENSPT